MTNILEAICNIVENQNFELESSSVNEDGTSDMKEALETYVKNAFGNTLDEASEIERMKKNSQVFSWLGNQNNPPNIMIKGGDAIEVKKTERENSSLAWNSSYPKSSLRSANPMITKGGKDCEAWTEKDLIYCVGHISKDKLNSLWMVYGHIYVAKDPIYQRIKDTISTGIKSIPNVEFSETKELGRANGVDLLGISNLRIRGMWQIENPRKVYNYLHEKTKASFELVTIIPLEKYKSFNAASRARIEGIEEPNFTIEDTIVKDPNNPAKLIDCKLVKFLK